jgi:hypothetical protein
VAFPAALLAAAFALRSTPRLALDLRFTSSVEGTAQVYFSPEPVFDERSSRSFPVRIGPQAVALEVPDGVRYLRIDPLDRPGEIRIESLRVGSRAGPVYDSGREFRGLRPLQDVGRLEVAEGSLLVVATGGDAALLLDGIAPPRSRWDWWAGAGVGLSAALLAGFLAARGTPIARALRRLEETLSRRLSARLGWVVFAWSLAVQTAYLLAYRPGLLSYDSFYQMEQVLGERPLNDVHPIVHTLLAGILYRIWFPEGLAAAQILSTSLLFAVGIQRLSRRAGVTLCLVMSAVAFLLPQIPLMSLHYWKDVLFSVFAVAAWAMTAFVDRMVARPRWFAAYVVAVIGAAFFRHNGLPFLLLWPAAAALFGRRALRRVAAASAGAFVAFFVLLPNLKGVERGFVPAVYLHESAMLARNRWHDDIPAPLRSVLSAIYPHGQVYAGYKPFMADPLWWNDAFDEAAYAARWRELRDGLLASLTWPDLAYVGAHRLLIVEGILTGRWARFHPGIDPNSFGVVPCEEPRLGFLKDSVRRFTSRHSWLSGSMPGFLVMFLVLVLGLARGNRRAVIFALPLVLQLPFVGAMTPSSEWRYSYFLHIGGFFAVPILLAGRGSSLGQLPRPVRWAFVATLAGIVAATVLVAALYPLSTRIL